MRNFMAKILGLSPQEFEPSASLHYYVAPQTLSRVQEGFLERENGRIFDCSASVVWSIILIRQSM